MEIARCWFRILEDVTSGFEDKEVYRQMKKDFANKTLVGEYIGN